MRIGAVPLIAVSLVATTLLLTCSTAAAQKSSPEALQVYSDAVNFQNAGQFDLAIEDWGKFLKKYPTDPLAGKARHYLGVCLTQQKKLDQAVVEFEKVIANHPKLELLEDTYLNLGSCCFTLAQQGKKPMYAKAAKAFADMIKAFPEGKYTDQGLYFQGESLYATGDKKGAVAAYAALVADHLKSKLRADGVYALGATQEELGQFAEAGKAYDTFLEEFADHKLATEVRMRKAETIMQAGQFAEAEKVFAEVAAVEGFASADHALFRQAGCVLKQNKFAEAGGLYAKLVTTFTKSTYKNDSIMLAGRCYYRAKQYPQAGKWFDSALKAGGADLPEATHWRCRIYLRDNKPAQAAALAEKTLPKAEKSKYLVNLKMDQADALYEIANRRSESVELYLKIAEDHEKHESAPQALYNAAYGLMDVGKHDDALTQAAAFLEKHPGHALTLDVQHVAAESNLLLKKYPEAETAYQELVAAAGKRPELEQWQVRLALVMYLQKKRKETVEFLTPLLPKLKAADNKAQAQFLVGTCHYYLGDYNAAVTALTASLAANPKWTQTDEVLLNLSRAQRKLNKFKEAIAAVKKLIDQYPNSDLMDRAHFRLAEYSYSSGDSETAVTEYDTVITTWEKSILVPHALFGKGWAQLRLKQYAAAAESFTALIDGHAGHSLIPGAHSARAMCRQQAGDFKGAIEDIDVYLQSNPALDDKIDALYVRGLCEVGLKSHAAAAKTFEAILKEKPDYSGAAKVLYELAWAYKSLKKDEPAVKNFKLLAKNHAGSPLAAEANYHVGEEQYAKKQYDAAVKSYTTAKAKAGKGDLGEKSTYKLAWSQYQLKDYITALVNFSDQVATYPNGKLISDGLFMKAECLFKQEKYALALAGYTAAQAKPASSKDISVLILLHGGQSASQTEQWKQAIAMFEKIPLGFPDSVYVPEAIYEQGWATQNLGEDRWDDAMKLYETATEKSRGKVGARARFMRGEIYFAKNDHAAAIREFLRVVLGYGGDQAPDEVKPWQAKSAYEVARCYEVQILDAKGQQRKQLISDALKYYNIVVEKFPDSPEAPAATKRVEELKKLK